MGLIELLHGLVEDGAECGLIDIFGHFLVGTYAHHMAEIEFEGALHVGVDGRRREHTFATESGLEQLHHISGLHHTVWFCRLCLAGSCKSSETDFLSLAEEVIGFCQCLQHET